jgi:hypothetical protein
METNLLMILLGIIMSIAGTAARNNSVEVFDGSATIGVIGSAVKTADYSAKANRRMRAIN